MPADINLIDISRRQPLFFIHLQDRVDRTYSIKRTINEGNWSGPVIEIPGQTVAINDSDYRSYKEAACRNPHSGIKQAFATNPHFPKTFAGICGCAKSHLYLLKMALDRGYSQFTVLEDDAELSPFFTKPALLTPEQLESTGMFLLGGQQFKLRKKAEWAAPVRVHGTHAYFINTAEARDTLYDRWSRMDGNVDHTMYDIFPHVGCLAHTPALIYQSGSWSSILVDKRSRVCNDDLDERKT